MVFSSLEFLFFYLPIVLVLMKISPIRFRNFILFFFSLIFYGWSEPYYILLMLLSTIVDYFNGIMVEKYYDDKKKAFRFVIFSVVFNLSLLGFFKYTDFIIASINTIAKTNIPLLGITLPIGISFYTFQTMSYPIDIYRGQAKAQKNPIDFGAYVAMFPQLIAGPIVRYKDIAEQLNHRNETSEKFASGVKRFCLGLFKKVFFANNIGSIFTLITGGTLENCMVLSWTALIAYALQIYFDFSGYSDMAIGLGRMFGFELLENFNYPYISKSISEFWRRWHISLGSWFRDYIYIPLGGNRGGILSTIRNLAVVWFLTGLWHGASWNYVLWGIYFGIIIIAEKFVYGKFLRKLPGLMQHLYVIFLVLIGWMIFAFEDLNTMYIYAQSLFDRSNIINPDTLFILRENAVMLTLGLAASTPIFKYIYQRINSFTQGLLDMVLVLIVLLICTAYLVEASFNPFLYFRF